MRFTSYLRVRSKDGLGDLTKKYANFPESYVKRTMEEVEWRTPRGYPQYMPKKIAHQKTNFTKDSPWSARFRAENEPGTRHMPQFVEPIKTWTFFKGDRVEILRGSDAGKQGIIVDVIQERNWVIVEGLNTELKAIGKTKKFPGTVVQVEKPLLVNHEVVLVDPADLKPTKIEWRYTEDGTQVRVSSRTGRIIPIPIKSQETRDFKSPSTYKESEKDTKSDDVTKITFVPRLSTFAMDIMKAQDIKEERIPVKTYWY